MDSEDDFGTEADGALSDDYCTHCYQNGAFTEPDITIDGMAKVCGAIMSQLYAISPKEGGGVLKGATLVPEEVGREGGRGLRELRDAASPG